MAMFECRDRVRQSFTMTLKLVKLSKIRTKQDFKETRLKNFP